jgi:hypothetical protein
VSASDCGVVDGLDLAELIDRKVAGALAEMNGRLEALVAQAVDRELDRLVRDLVEAELQTRMEEDLPQAPDDVPPPTKTCSSCGETKAATAFQSGRATCRPCRRRQQAESKRRRREAAEVPAVPFGGSGSKSTGSAGSADSSTAPSAT